MKNEGEEKFVGVVLVLVVGARGWWCLVGVGLLLGHATWMFRPVRGYHVEFSFGRTLTRL